MCWILDSDGLDFESNGVWVGFRFFFFDKQVGFRLVCLGWCGGAVMGVVMIGFLVIFHGFAGFVAEILVGNGQWWHGGRGGDWVFGYFVWVCWVCG